MNKLQIFNYNNNEIRTVMKDGVAWFVAKDVCNVLGLANPTKAIKKLDEDERSNLLLGRQGEANIINEFGLYTLILRSNKPQAKDFRRWVTHEVIPDIRKHGMYISEKLRDTAQADPEAFETVVNKYLAEKKKVKALEAQIAEDRAYTTIGKCVCAMPGSVTIAEAANFLTQKGIHIGRNRLYKWGREQKLLCSQKKRYNKPTQKGIESGLLNIELDTSTQQYKITTQTMVTAEGLKNLLNALFSAEYPLFPEIPYEEE